MEAVSHPSRNLVGKRQSYKNASIPHLFLGALDSEREKGIYSETPSEESQKEVTSLSSLIRPRAKAFLTRCWGLFTSMLTWRLGSSS